jgi:hypothetical protein
LRGRRVRVHVSGRDAGHRERVIAVLLPGPDGAIAPADCLAARDREWGGELSVAN